MSAPLTDEALQQLRAEGYEDAANELLALRAQVARALAPNVSLSPAPPLRGRWQHGNGVLVCGGVKIATANFGANSSAQIQTEIFDWMCDALNIRSYMHNLEAKK
ncbi:MAG: hypothetical protein Q7U16_10250 [Agitococcus sp.]|nr:hypothetical protein [Agitococcus sp.]